MRAGPAAPGQLFHGFPSFVNLRKKNSEYGIITLSTFLDENKALNLPADESWFGKSRDGTRGFKVTIVCGTVGTKAVEPKTLKTTTAECDFFFGVGGLGVRLRRRGQAPGGIGVEDQPAPLQLSGWLCFGLWGAGVCVGVCIWVLCGCSGMQMVAREAQDEDDSNCIEGKQKMKKFNPNKWQDQVGMGLTKHEKMKRMYGQKLAVVGLGCFSAFLYLLL